VLKTSSSSTSEIDHELQKAMLVVIEQLTMLRHLHRDARQASQIRADITAAAQWIDFLSDQQAHDAIEVGTQQPELVKLGARIVCESCRKGPKDNSGNTSGQEDSAPPPIWSPQLKFLVACTERVGVEMFQHDCASYNPIKFSTCLAKLARTLRRLQRSLAPTEVRETRIGAEHCSHNCAECGQPINPSPEAVL